MTQKFRSPKGTRDLLPSETAVWAAVESTARDVFGRYGFGEIRTPIFESTALFVRGVGESSDIVGKEMYSFESRGGDALTLRPESTASVARAYVEHGMQQLSSPVKLFYIGPQFRYERPQAGRYRQFSQIGAELLGDPGPVSDAELIVMLVEFLRSLDIERTTVLLNTLGDDESRKAYREALTGFLAPLADQLGPDSRRRLDTNPLRILDTKDPREQELIAQAPKLADHLTDASREHVSSVQALLERFGTPYRIEDRLVRGLDYYTGTVFEIVAEGLGAQDAIVGGGRYDRLISDLGGPQVPGIGFAIGEDRLVSVLPETFVERVQPSAPVIVAAIGGVDPAEALILAGELRSAGIAALAELTRRSIKNTLKKADKRGASTVLLLGDDELADDTVTIKNLTSGEQERIARASAIDRLIDRLNEPQTAESAVAKPETDE